MMQHPESLRKSQLLIFTVARHSRHSAAEVENNAPSLAPLQAPGFVSWVRACQPYNPWGTSGFGKGGFKGYQKGMGPACPPGVKFEKCYAKTVHPLGRALQDLWVVESQQQLVLVVHAVDGRVCVGQLCGVQEVIPEPRTRTSDRHAPQLWDIWPR